MINNNVMAPAIMTASGLYFDFLEPNKNEIRIFDIAHALSNTCRFGGHSKQFYSVAQHAVLVSHLVPPLYAWQGLHHDDAEAYLGDIPTPLKQLLPEFKVIEHNVEQVIWSHFKAGSVLDRSVKIADLQALMIERYHLVPPDKDGKQWSCFEGVPVPTMIELKPLPPAEAKELFLNRYSELVSRYK